MATVDNAAAIQDFLVKQVELVNAGDAHGLSLRYAEDAVFVRFDTTARGRAAIEKHFADYIAEGPEIKGMDGLEVQDNVILYQADEMLNGKSVTAVGTLVFVDGLVWRQTAVFINARPPAA